MSTSRKRIPEHELVVLGGGGVGKSAITIQYVQSRFEMGWDPTIEDTYRKPAVVDRQEVMLAIIDTAGQEEYRLMRPGYLRSAQGFLLVYDITSRVSFNDVSRFHDEICQAKDLATYPAIILLGNKADLADRRQVKTSEGEELARRMKCGFMECSAKFRENIDEAFHAVVRAVRKYNHKNILDRTADLLAGEDGPERTHYGEEEPKGCCTIS
ncbi:ras GTPase [Dacryopinax primogenitus]|uniref:Ras GTPase n=1 Tax=Dacryopinax primogenitus (strain DJM 731) TaxID=1858805 RepID=M5G2W9_DACPD|nr:ras GTPase [Dacryopinax primogenitus]EJU04576.1 ras GTPase [Dacryopinax primogenitus]